MPKQKITLKQFAALLERHKATNKQAKGWLDELEKFQQLGVNLNVELEMNMPDAFNIESDNLPDAEVFFKNKNYHLCEVKTAIGSHYCRNSQQSHVLQPILMSD